MALYLSDDDDSANESEVFVGPITLPEIEIQFIPKKDRHTVGYSSNAASNEDGCGESFKLIEKQSAPSILYEEPKLQQSEISKLSLSPHAYSSWDIKPNDSFLQIEKMISDLCVNTIDITEQISKQSKGDHKNIQSVPLYITEVQINDQTEVVEIVEKVEQNFETPHKLADATNLLAPEANISNIDLITPTKQNITPGIYSTPLQERIHPSVFKTPGLPAPQNRFQTPATKRSFQHVVSPVATYINKSPVAPLVKNVRPKKPLVRSSAIPKPIKSALKANSNNKENNNLPCFAYRAAKETKMTDTPDEHKLPHNQRANQLLLSIPKATVMKHDHRDGSLKMPLHNQEDSFADLSVHEAKVSNCTQKCALNKPQKLT